MIKIPKKSKGDEVAGKPAPKTGGGKRAGRINDKASRFVLFMGDDGVILILIQGSKVVRRMFAASPEKEHVQPFIELMEANPKAPVYVLVDVIDQSYVRHTLPPVSPLGVNKLVNRRLERDFAPEDINGALSLGREKAGRKEWNFLLISLANSSLIQQWTDLLMELPNRFMGLYLAPVEAQPYLEALSTSVAADASASWKILVTHNKVSGYRQVVLRDGNMIFTRLTQSGGDIPADVAAGNVEQEVLNTIEYLRRLAYNEQAGLEIHIIVAQEVKDRIDASKFRATRVNLFTPFEVSQLLDLGQAALSSDRFGDVVLGSYFGLHRKAALKLNSASGRKMDRVYLARTAVRAAAALVIAVCLFKTVGDAIAISSASGRIADMGREKETLQAELAQVEADLAALGDDQTSIINTVALYRAARVEGVDPLAIVRMIAPTLEGGVLVRSYAWTLSPEDKSAAGTPAAAPQTEVPRMAPFELKLEVEFTQHGGDREKLVADAKGFLSRLKQAFGSYEITEDKLPGGQSDGGQLSVNFNDPSVKDKTLKEGENVAQITIRGPKPEDNAATPPAAAVPGGML